MIRCPFCQFELARAASALRATGHAGLDAGPAAPRAAGRGSRIRVGTFFLVLLASLGAGIIVWARSDTSLQSIQSFRGAAAATPRPFQFTLALTDCGWPETGGRTLHVKVTNVNVRSLPVGPGHFTVENFDRPIRRDGTMPSELKLAELRSVELKPGETAEGWIYFSISPMQLANLDFDNGVGNFQTVPMLDCGAPRFR